MTDERMGDALWPALARLPRGSGVVFRHHSLPPLQRERLGRSVARLCRRRGLILAVSRDVGLARRLGAALVHNPTGSHGLLPHSRSVHDDIEAQRAKREGAALAFISPVFATRSHDGGEALGIAGAVRLAQRSGGRSIALGGMGEARFTHLRACGFHGYAGIDCWIRI
jgi:thiamine-phosphate pyrophosphorylase